MGDTGTHSWVRKKKLRTFPLSGDNSREIWDEEMVKEVKKEDFTDNCTFGKSNIYGASKIESIKRREIKRSNVRSTKRVQM